MVSYRVYGNALYLVLSVSFHNAFCYIRAKNTQDDIGSSTADLFHRHGRRQTNHVHWQYYTNLSFERFDGFLLMTFGKGLWYWIFVGYNILIILISSAMIVVYLNRAPRAYRKQGSQLLLGTIIPVIPYFLYSCISVQHVCVDTRWTGLARGNHV
jgi:hypothetical protein